MLELRVGGYLETRTDDRICHIFDNSINCCCNNNSFYFRRNWAISHRNYHFRKQILSRITSLMIFMSKDFDEYEKEYLKRLEEKKKEQQEITKIHNPTPIEAVLDDLDYMILALRYQGLNKLKGVTARLPKVNLLKVNSSYEKIKKLGYIENDKKDSWTQRNFDPRFNITEKGIEVLEEKKKLVAQIWEKIKGLSDSKKKDEFRKEVEKNRDMFPFFMIMGFTNGAMMGTMMAQMDMNYQMMQQGMDYAYVDGGGDYDGGFSDGGGDSGGFMDGGFQPGF